MAFDFPNSPIDGTVFAPAGGPTYIFSGGVWKISGGGGAFVVVSDAAPPSPYPGMLWFESDTGALFFWYVDANSSQWVQINFTPSGMRTAESRNRVVNPAMQISQENGNAGSNVIGYYPADQWPNIYASTGVAGTFRVAMTTVNGSKYRIALSVTTADASIAAGEYWELYQYIEGIRVADFLWGTAQARQAILRFGWRGPAGTYCVSIINAAGTRSYIAQFTITAGQANTDTTQTFVIPGDTTGVWPNDTGTWGSINFVLAGGTSFQGALGWQTGMMCTAAQSNGLSSTSNAFYLSDVGLYMDPQNTGIAPPWQMPDEADELIACKRYWQKVSLCYRFYAPNTNLIFDASVILPVLPRVAAALSLTAGSRANVTTHAFYQGVTFDSIREEMQNTAVGDCYALNDILIANARM